jgi:hypothetical protein
MSTIPPSNSINPSPNVGLTPPPLQTPITADAPDDFGVPFQFRGSPSSGNLNVAWMAHFNNVYVRTNGLAFLSGTRAQRLNTDPSKPTYDAKAYRGFAFLETDTRLLYIAVASSFLITNATNTTPIVITAENNFASPPMNEDQVKIVDVVGNLGANGVFIISAASPTGFTLTGSVGTGAYVSGGTVTGPIRWTYVKGSYNRTQSQLAALAATLTSGDKGLLVNVTDYSHVLQWNGSGFVFVEGDSSNYYVEGGTSAPFGGKWAPADGSTVSVLKGDGTLMSVTTWNFNGTGQFVIASGPAIPGGGLSASVAKWSTVPQAKTDVEDATHTQSEAFVGDTRHFLQSLQPSWQSRSWHLGGRHL